MNFDNAGSDPRAAEENWLCRSPVIWKKERTGRNRGYVPNKLNNTWASAWACGCPACWHRPPRLVFNGSLSSLFRGGIKWSGLERYRQGTRVGSSPTPALLGSCLPAAPFSASLNSPISECCP